MLLLQPQHCEQYRVRKVFFSNNSCCCPSVAMPPLWLPLGFTLLTLTIVLAASALSLVLASAVPQLWLVGQCVQRAGVDSAQSSAKCNCLPLASYSRLQMEQRSI